jgi:hypothetical protein
MKSDDRRCAAGHRCRAASVHEGKRVGRRLEKPAGLCRDCQLAVTRATRQLPHDWCKLKLTIGENRSVATEATRKPKPSSRILLNLEADELMRLIAFTLEDAALLVASEVNVTRPSLPRNPASRVQYQRLISACDLVQPRVETLCELAAGPDVALKLLDLHHRAVMHLGETAQRERLHLPCPSCGRLALVREVQDRRGRQSVDGVETPEVIRCTACDGTWTEAEYAWLSQMVRSEKEEHHMLKWLLAEANWRLEQIGKIADLMQNDPSVVEFKPDSFATAIKDYLPPDIRARIDRGAA